ncbi:hypothetical protein BJY04DRAFT_219696 [Aspergillus karnatakaensis]|uniref:uncharacterized protein n=1 Tax=Aspergillus karnatakaensis TaxID=1810916 RepID=UPI003CCCCD56
MDSTTTRTPNPGHGNGNGSTPRPPQKRVSNACVPCRARHMKCDSKAPVCSRCQAEGSKCVYIKSRRGGGRRAPQVQDQDQGQIPARIEHARRAALLPGALAPARTSNAVSYPVQCPGYRPTAASAFDDSSPESTESDLVGLYYTFFHPAHPCILPQWSLRIRIALDPVSLQTLLPVIEYIGSLYSSSTLSAPLERAVLQAFACLRARTSTSSSTSDGTHGQDPTPFDIQAIILYCIAVYWNDEIPRALDLLDDAIAGAVRIGLNSSGFDTAYGEGDLVLEESLRRTWWVVYLTSVHIAGSMKDFPARVERVEMDGGVGLPCEEGGYEAGEIPSPPTLQDYEMREFHSQETVQFSSFAELIGLSRSINLVLGGGIPSSSEGVTRVCGNADTSILAWLLLLPREKQSLVKRDGSVDQLLFRGYMLIYTYIVDLNRQFSTLHQTPLESLSRRTPRAPPPSSFHMNSQSQSQPCEQNLVMHTTKVLTAISKMHTLLTLPIELTTHTPFTICMISNTAIAHLAAYKWVYGYQERKIERGRIRLVIAILKELGAVWPLGRRTVEEVVAVARDVIGDGESERVSIGLRGFEASVSFPEGGLEMREGVEMEMQMGFTGEEFESAMQMLSAGMGGFDGLSSEGSSSFGFEGGD